MSSKDVNKMIQIENGILLPSDAYDLLYGLFKEQINFNKLQRLSAWERYHQCDTSPWDEKIERINTEMENLNQLIVEAKKEGLHLQINCNIEIKTVSSIVSSRQFEMLEN